MSGQTTSIINGDITYTKSYSVPERVTKIIVSGKVDASTGIKQKIPFKFDFIAPY